MIDALFRYAEERGRRKRRDERRHLPVEQRWSDDDWRVDQALATGVRFTVAEMEEMAEAFMAGRTPPPLSFNESVVLQTFVRGATGEGETP